MVSKPVPSLTTSLGASLQVVEKHILQKMEPIEAWFREKWLAYPAPITSSVDLRHAGFKLAPVDTNLFPAGFNNLNKDFYPLCIQAIQTFVRENMPHCTKILLIPENHTRNLFYFKSLKIFQDILINAGFLVKVGSFDPELYEPKIIELEGGEIITISPVSRLGDSIVVGSFKPCLVILNNDLSAGIPSLLQNLSQPIFPSIHLGWSMRLKSHHFSHYQEITKEFAELIELDPWFITPSFVALDHIDFQTSEDLEKLEFYAKTLLEEIASHYRLYGIKEKPFVAVKADNGTYGMGVMMVHDAQTLVHLNRKQRTKMASSKGGQKVTKIIIQEGIYTFETMPNGAVAEPVVYMIGQYVVGGFYRVHRERGNTENLNAPGMHFEPLSFMEPCNMPNKSKDVSACPNRFYIYGVIARLAALAAGYEIKQLEDH